MLSHNGKRKYSLATPYKVQRWIKKNNADSYSYETNDQCLEKENAPQPLTQYLAAKT